MFMMKLLFAGSELGFVKKLIEQMILKSMKKCLGFENTRMDLADLEITEDEIDEAMVKIHVNGDVVIRKEDLLRLISKKIGD